MRVHFNLVLTTKICMAVGISSLAMGIPSALAADIDPKTPVIQLKSGSVLKFKSSKGSIKLTDAKKGTTEPKIVVAAEIQARDITFDLAKSFVQKCHPGEQTSQVASLVIGALAGFDGVDQREKLKIYAHNDEKGKNEASSANAFFNLIEARLQNSWPRDQGGDDQDDPDKKYAVKKECLRGQFLNLYTQLSRVAVSCDVHFDLPSVAKLDSLDLKSIQSITLGTPQSDDQGWTKFPVKNPNKIKSFSCPKFVKTVGDLGSLIDIKKSTLAAAKPTSSGTVNLGSASISGGVGAKILPSSGPADTKNKTNGSVQSSPSKDAVK